MQSNEKGFNFFVHICFTYWIFLFHKIVIDVAKRECVCVYGKQNTSHFEWLLIDELLWFMFSKKWFQEEAANHHYWWNRWWYLPNNWLSFFSWFFYVLHVVILCVFDDDGHRYYCLLIDVYSLSIIMIISEWKERGEWFVCDLFFSGILYRKFSVGWAPYICGCIFVNSARFKLIGGRKQTDPKQIDHARRLRFKILTIVSYTVWWNANQKKNIRQKNCKCETLWIGLTHYRI